MEALMYDPKIQMFLDAVAREFYGAKRKFPSNRFNVAALGEETGELNKALLDAEFGKEHPSNIYTEAVQTASMAMRIALDGSQEFSYAYDPTHAETFHATGEA
jgi:hypothetical protein